MNEIAETSTAVWFHEHLGMSTEIPLLIKAVDEGTGFGEQGSLSLAQWCEAVEEKRVLANMRNDERLHIISNRGPGCSWIRTAGIEEMGNETEVVGCCSQMAFILTSCTQNWDMSCLSERPS